MWLNLGKRCADGKASAARESLDTLARELFPQPMVEVSGLHDVDVSLARNHGKLQVTLVQRVAPEMPHAGARWSFAGVQLQERRDALHRGRGADSQCRGGGVNQWR